MAFGGLSSHGLELRRSCLLEAGSVGGYALEPLVTHLCLGSVFLMETEVVDKLLLDLKCLPTLLTLVPFQVEVSSLVVLQGQQVVVTLLAD